jgi:hypothetical protein
VSVDRKIDVRSQGIVTDIVPKADYGARDAFAPTSYVTYPYAVSHFSVFPLREWADAT